MDLLGQSLRALALATLLSGCNTSPPPQPPDTEREKDFPSDEADVEGVAPEGSFGGEDGRDDPMVFPPIDISSGSEGGEEDLGTGSLKEGYRGERNVGPTEHQAKVDQCNRAGKYYDRHADFCTEIRLISTNCLKNDIRGILRSNQVEEFFGSEADSFGGIYGQQVAAGYSMDQCPEFSETIEGVTYRFLIKFVKEEPGDGAEPVVRIKSFRVPE